jgi:hypothetical protein
MFRVSGKMLGQYLKYYRESLVRDAVWSNNRIIDSTNSDIR